MDVPLDTHLLNTGDLYLAPGPNRALRGKFIGDVVGTHYLYFQVFYDSSLICTSNTIAIHVKKIKKKSSISVSVTLLTIERGKSVEISGYLSPGRSAKVTLRIISPDGREIIRETTSTSTGAFSYTFTPDTVGK